MENNKCLSIYYYGFGFVIFYFPSLIGIASIRGSTITATVSVMVSFFLVVAVIAVFAAIGFLAYKNWQKKQKETRFAVQDGS